MPAAYTHHCLAREAYLSSPEKIQELIRNDLPLYFFGAQGADFCFFYPSWKIGNKNVGSYLHRQGSFAALQLLKTLFFYDRQIFSYALGYLTHYAADSILHPYIYATAGKSVLQHARLENILDIRLKKKAHSQTYDEYFRKKLTPKEQDTLFLLYTALAAKNKFPMPKKSAFSLAIATFNATIPPPEHPFRRRKREGAYTCRQRGETILGIPCKPYARKQRERGRTFLQSENLLPNPLSRFFPRRTKQAPLTRGVVRQRIFNGHIKIGPYIVKSDFLSYSIIFD